MISRVMIIASASFLLLAAPAGFAYAQHNHAAGSAADLKGGPTPSPAGSAVYFIDLKDGQTVPTKFTVHFGLRGMGVAPAGSDRENSGHHHLLIDTELPPLDQPIPNDFNHLHFGAGQTEAQVTLTPGPHTLQLLLGDKDHIPTSPPLYSERIHVQVVDPASANTRGAPVAAAAAPAPAALVRHSSPPGARVYFVYPTDNATIPPNPTIRFGLVNMGVAPAGVEKANTGHHHIIIDAPLPPLDQPIPNDFNHLHFGSGQTEAKITLTPGRHTLQLLLGDENHMPHEPPVYSAPIHVTVVDPAAARAPVAHKPHAAHKAHPRHRPKERVRTTAAHRPRPERTAAPPPAPSGPPPFFGIFDLR